MEKPLPDIPAPTVRPNQPRTANNLADLTIESHAHLRKFLSCQLEQEESIFNRDEWVNAIESGLREVGEGVSMGGWFAGLKRAKLLTGSLRRKERSGQSVGSEKSGASKKLHADGERASDYSAGNGVQVFRNSEDLRRLHLESIRTVLSRPTSPTPKPRVRHLLLTASSYDAQEPENAKVKSAGVRCKFASGRFPLPSKDILDDELEIILYGLDEWSDLLEAEDALQIVGGTFIFQGTVSALQLAALRKILRVSLFVYFSLLLEQHTLSDSHAALRFRKPSITPTGYTGAVTGSPILRALSTSHVGHRSRKDPASSFWSFLSKKKDAFVRRAVEAAPSLVRRGSLDLPLTTPPASSPQARNSDSSPSGPRRMSILGDFRPTFMLAQKEEPIEEPPFASTLTLLKKHEDLYSTSPGVRFGPPPLLTLLAHKEKEGPERKLTGDERAALANIVGWTTKAAKGNGMSGIPGFVLQQGLCVLYSEHTPSGPLSTSRPATPAQRMSSSSSVLPVDSSQKTICCGKRIWVTFRYWDRGAGLDECLGEAVVRMCRTAQDLCQEPRCTWMRAEHELHWTHGNVRISSNISFSPEEERPDGSIEMWESCQVCGKESMKETMSDGTYLYSFAKYLELLIYSPAIVQLSTPLCEHTTVPPQPWNESDAPLPRMRANIVRNFRFKGRHLSLSLSMVEDVFDVSVPRLQIIRGKAAERTNDVNLNPDTVMEPDRRALRREIMKWWQGLSEHMDNLEENFVIEPSRSYHKSLPRLPSASIDAAYEFLDDDNDDDDGVVTPRAHPSMLPSHTPNPPWTPRVASGSSVSHSFPDQLNNPQSTFGSMPSSLTVPLLSSTEPESLKLLSSLRHSFQRTEQNLYSELAHTPEAFLNDVRRSFRTAAKGATRRLAAWQMKHTPGAARSMELSASSEPSWWSPECHPVPGSNVIVRENDWGSIIAFTLSSQDYGHELANMTSNRSHIMPAVPPQTPAVQSLRPSFFSKDKWFAPSTPQPDPDQDDVVWHEPEEYSAVISRKEHPKDSTSLLMTIPEVLRKAPVDLSSLPAASKFSTSGVASGKATEPPLLRSKPDVQVSMQAADAMLSGVSPENVDKIISELEAVSDLPRSRRNSGSGSQISGSSFFEANIRRGKASSIMTDGSVASTIGPPSSGSYSDAPPVPPKNQELTVESGSPHPTDSTISGVGSSMTETLTSTLSAALRYMVKGDESPPLLAKHHHGLLSTASPAIDERPHIKYDWTIGKRLKFSCTVYYAKQFDSLRRRCGVEDTFLRSMARSENWLAEGGKSKSNFWRTSDNQYIIKTLVNAWNVADLQVLIDLGPSYFRYMDATASKATVLAKILGFYTIEIRNLENGNVQAKADLLVMENLFYDQNIGKTFDLKGIQGRKVKASAGGDQVPSKTLFDGEWIEGQQRALTLVRPHSKAILTEAIKADCEFLAKSNIMDYSLLVGVCEERKQIACGLVDVIGSYTFAKTLEYKAKHGLSSGKEVTVVPPGQYQERFVKAMDSYFVACPDKWSRPLDDTLIPSNYESLPSVL